MAEYQVLNIKSDGKTKQIVCDHPDGKFLLVAVINYLSLHRNLSIEDNWEQVISEKVLLETIQNLLDFIYGWSPEDNTSWNQVSTVLPMLATKIDLDPYLNSIDGFGSSNATAAVLEAIKVLEIPLFHGCLMDPKKASALHGCAYSGILELYTTEPLPGAKATDLEQWALVREFVETTDKQLNSYGISCIRDHMILNNQKFAVLYRNGEFKLLGLHHGIIHILQTEAGDFEDVDFDRLCVWKTLCNVDEDGIAVTGNFRAVDDENANDVLKLYMEGWRYNKSLPQRIHDEQLAERIAKAEQNAKELISMEQLERKQRAKKAAAASRKKCETSNTPVFQPSDMSADGEQFPPLLPSQAAAETPKAADTPKAAADTSEAADTPEAAAVTSEAADTPKVAETPEDQNADTSEAASTASQSNASILFRVFLDTSHYCGRSEIPYFVGEVKLMKERNLFELSVDYSHIKDDCEELSVLIRDDIDGSVRKDLEECLVQYLKDKGVENEKAEKAVLKILEAREGYQSFVELAEENRLKFVDCHQIYQQTIGGPEMEISSSPKSVSSVHNTGVVYPMRQIDFLGHSTHIICQDENGPCPLISICNCLLLKGRINFECHLIEVPMERLVHIVQDLVKERLKIKVCYSFAEGSILDVVPTLAKGLDIDVKFNRTDGFTATPGTMLFDCLEIPLYHGWLPDEEDMAGELPHSFETLTWAVREPHFPNVEKVEKFLNGSQLTAYGLACLHEDVIEKVPSVHYWNMHFSTIIKYNGALYTLVSDAGYLKSNVVWQMLNEINGAGSYMSSDFTPIDLDLGATPSGRGGILPEIYFKSAPKRPVMSLKKFILERGIEFSVKRTLCSAGTPLDVAATTRIGRIMALDILRDLIGAHSSNLSYNGAFGLSSIYVLHNGRAAICASFFGDCTNDTKSKDFETYISDILEKFRIDEVGLPAHFTHLINLLRTPGSFIHPRYFWDCVLTTFALKSPLSRAGLFQGIHRIRRFAPNEVQSSLKNVLRGYTHSDWRQHILAHGHPLLRKVLQYGADKSLEDKGVQGAEGDGGKKYGLYRRNLYSLSIFPRQVNEHGKPKVEGGKVEGSKQVEEEGEEPCSKVEGDKQVEEEGGEESGGRVEGTKQVEEEWEEPFELLSDLDLLYSHHLDISLPRVLEALLCRPGMTPELWKWVKEVLQEYDKPEAMDPAPWDR